MPVTLTLLGLNRLSASLGAALAKDENVLLVGYDREPETSKRAQQKGFIKRVEWTLPNAVANADLVLLAEPLAYQRETLQLIAKDLRAGGVVASFCNLLQAPLQWGAAALKPEAEHYFVAAHPILNPAQLLTDEVGLDAAHADLFKKGLWALASAPGCAPEALKLMADLAQLLGASPYFMDPIEHDGLMGATEALPALFAWALFQATNGSSGWAEARKVADRNFATATLALADLETASLRHNREATLHYLDAALRELQTLRDWLSKENSPALQVSWAEAQQRRAEWLTQRARGDWDAVEQGHRTAVPTAGDMLSKMLFGGFFKRDKGKDGK